MVKKIGNASDNVLHGTTLDDLLVGKDGNDTLLGMDGNDTLFGGNDNDIVNGGNGDDYLSGGNGNDKLIGGDGYNDINGGLGNDIMSGGINADAFHGGKGMDTVDYSGSTTKVSVYLPSNSAYYGAAGDTFEGIENIKGSAYDDYLQVGSQGGTVMGGAGDDHLYGGGSGGQKGGVLVGGGGYDTLDMFYGATMAQLQNGKGYDTIVNFKEDNDTFQIKLSEFGLGNSLDSNEITNSNTVTATGTNAQFIYEDDSHSLWFDSNGTDSGGLSYIAYLQNSTILDHDLGTNDFHAI